MSDFLSRVAVDILESFSKIHRVAILVTSKRAERALRRALMDEAASPIISPAIFTIEQFMMDLSGLSTANTMDQLIVLYDSYKKIKNNNAESLEDFLKWSPTVLKDFDEIQRFGVDIEKVYKDLKEIESISQWGLKEPTKLMTRRINLWKEIPELFKVFQKNMENEGIGTPGHIFNSASPANTGPSLEKIKNWSQQNEIDNFVFVGFNALPPPELALFKKIEENYKTQTFWDVDEHYIHNPKAEAGKHLRDNIKQLPKAMTGDLVNPPASFLTSKIEFSVLKANGNIAIAKAIGEILDSPKLKTKNYNKCAVVLTDEKLLIPVLQAFPDEIFEANVTMGMALHSTNFYSSLDILFQLQEAKEISGSYSSKLLESSFKNSICCYIYYGPTSRGESLNMNAQIKALRDSQKSYWSVNETLELLRKHSEFWGGFEDSNSFLKALEKKLISYSSNLLSTWEKEPVELCIKAIQRISSWNGSLTLKFHTLRQLFRQFAKESPINFIGEPFEGIQIMGLLETRNLDFETVIIAPCNEGLLPSQRGNSSFLTNDIRKAYKIFLPRDNEAITAYHTYRLIQRAKQVYFLVNNNLEGLHSSETSRFVQQMEFELSRYSGVKWKNHELQLELNPTTLDQEREIINSSNVIQRTLKKLIEKGLSPSSGSTYIRNPYKFYLTFILGIQEEKTIEDRLPANIRGNILHDLHQDLYTNYNATLLWDLSIVKTSLEKSLLKYFPGSNISGHLLLEKKVIQKIANDWSQNEEKRIKRKKEKAEKWKVSFVEEFLESSLELSNGKTIKIRGKADRIEECEKYWVIIDLKTGSFKKNDIQFTQWSDLLDRTKKKDKAFQLLMYTWLLSRQEKFENIKKFKAGISSMRHPKKAISYLSWDGKADLELKDLVDFENFVLVPLIESILNPEIPFRDTLEL